MLFTSPNFTGGVRDKNYFGDGSDGAITISSDTEISVTPDSGVAIMNYASLTIDAGASLTTNNRCKALLVYVQGDCTINGHLHMDAKGAAASALEANLFRRKFGGSSTSSKAPAAIFTDEKMKGGSGKNQT